MLAFAICLGCAGALLSTLVRVHALVAVLVLMVLATVASTALAVFGLETSGSTAVNVVVAVVALQVGYGTGVILRGMIGRFRDLPRVAPDGLKRSEKASERTRQI